MSSRRRAISACCNSFRRRKRGRRRCPFRSRAANSGSAAPKSNSICRRVSCSSRFSISASSTRARNRPLAQPVPTSGLPRWGGDAGILFLAPTGRPDREHRSPRSPSSPATTLPRPRAYGPWLGRGSDPAGVIRHGGDGSGARPRVVDDLVAVVLQPCSHVRRHPAGGSRAVGVDGEDVIGHRVSQQGSGIHGTKGAASSASCRPGLRPYEIPAGWKLRPKGSGGRSVAHRLLVLQQPPRDARVTAASPNGLAIDTRATPTNRNPVLRAGRNDSWTPAVTTTATASRSLLTVLRRRGPAQDESGPRSVPPGSEIPFRHRLACQRDAVRPAP